MTEYEQKIASLKKDLCKVTGELILKPKFSYTGSSSIPINEFSYDMQSILSKLMLSQGKTIVYNSSYFWTYTKYQYNSKTNLIYTKFIINENFLDELLYHISSSGYSPDFNSVVYSQIVKSILETYGELGPDTWMEGDITIYEPKETIDDEKLESLSITKMDKLGTEGNLSLELFLSSHSITINTDVDFTEYQSI